MSVEDLLRGFDALADDDVRAKVADGDVQAAGGLELSDEERDLLVAAASEEPEVVGHAINIGLAELKPTIRGSKLGTSAQDVTVNKAKTADKAFNAMSAYIKG